jgi:hypothetical protein
MLAVNQKIYFIYPESTSLDAYKLKPRRESSSSSSYIIWQVLLMTSGQSPMCEEWVGWSKVERSINVVVNLLQFDELLKIRKFMSKCLLMILVNNNVPL